MALAPKQKLKLKAQAHQLKPIILIGNNGLSKNVNEEIDRALNDHELVKIRIHAEDRLVRRELFNEICQLHQADIIQLVGKVGVIYRKNND